MKDGRQLVGQMLAFDKVCICVHDSVALHPTNSSQHMNLVLADTEEFRRVKRKTKASGAPGGSGQQLVETEEKRALGLAIVRGSNVVSCSLDGPPPADPSARLGNSAPGGAGAPAAMAAGPGISRPAGRGAGIGLQGPAAGVGGPGFAGRGAAPGFPPGFPPAGFAPPGFGGAPPGGFAPPPGGRGFPPR
jgi:small nuclear ribonucleoprotein B and B'